MLSHKIILHFYYFFRKQNYVKLSDGVASLKCPAIRKFGVMQKGRNYKQFQKASLLTV